MINNTFTQYYFNFAYNVILAFVARDKWKPISFTEWKLLNSIQVWFCSNQPYALQSGSN